MERDLVLSRALVAIFSQAAVSRAEFEANFAGKLTSAAFLEDLRLLIPPEVDYYPIEAAEVIQDQLIAKLPGEPWKGSQGK